MRAVPRKLAISTWEGRVSPVFDVSREFMLIEPCDGRLEPLSPIALSSPDPLSKVAQLAEAGVEVLICGAISAPVRMAAEAQRIRVLSFIAGETTEVLNAFLINGLSGCSMRMPGCGQGRRHRCRRRGGVPPRQPNPQKPISGKD